MNFFKTLTIACLLLTTTLPALPAYAEEVFDVDFASGTPIIEAIRSLGYRANKNVVINGELTGTVALSLSQTTFYKALDLIATANGFNYAVDDDAIIVSTSDKMSNIKTYQVKYLDLEALKKQLTLFIPEAKININKDANTVTIDGSSAQIDKASEHLNKYDVAQQQIVVKATVIELSQSKAREMGLDLSTDPYTKGNRGINYMITGTHEETKGFGNILARPSVTVFNGRKASILMGDKVPVFTSTSSGKTAADYNSSVTVEYKDVGVCLEVTPRINDRNKETVSMHIKPSISTIAEWVESGNNKAPRISTRELETDVRVKAGETIYLGGLLKEQEIKNIKAIPFLSKLPILGELFKKRSTSKEKTEIVIALTPTIISDVDGIPQLGTQETSHPVRRKLKELQKEPLEAALQDALDKKAELEKLLKKAEKEAKEKEAKDALNKTIKEKDTASLRAEREKNKRLVDEIKKTNELLQKYL